MTTEVFAELSRLRVVPVVEITEPARGVELAQTLVEAGLPVAEVTLRTREALASIEAIAAAVPELLLGAGTLLSAADLRRAAEAGARFGVSPGGTPALSEAAAAADLPFIPGAVTPSEVLAAAGLGHRHLKFFPASQYGGPATLTSLASPLAGLGVGFMPTGGVRPDDVSDYLVLPNVFAVGGTWIAPRASIERGDWDAVGRAAQQARRLGQEA